MVTSVDSYPAVLLSREEVLAILSVLGVGALPGLGPEPIGKLSNEQIAYGIVGAERALRARGLARISNEGHLLIDQYVLDMVGSCAFAEGSQIITVTDVPGGLTQMYFAYRRRELFVLQTSPSSQLFLYQTQPNQSALTETLISLCDVPVGLTAATEPILVSDEVLAQVRDLAVAGRADNAKNLLQTHLAGTASVDALISIITGHHRVAIFQSIAFGEDDTAAVQSVTIIYNDEDLWLAVEEPAGDGEEPNRYLLQRVNQSILQNYLDSLTW